jgi:hypothetical protein
MAIEKSGSKRDNQRSNRGRIEQWKQEVKWSSDDGIRGKPFSERLAVSIQIQM